MKSNKLAEFGMGELLIGVDRRLQAAVCYAEAVKNQVLLATELLKELNAEVCWMSRNNEEAGKCPACDSELDDGKCRKCGICVECG